jgi:hypothetical protein
MDLSRLESTLSIIPSRVLTLFLFQLIPNDIHQLYATSRFMSKLISNDVDLWRKLYIRDYLNNDQYGTGYSVDEREEVWLKCMLTLLKTNRPTETTHQIQFSSYRQSYWRDLYITRKRLDYCWSNGKFTTRALLLPEPITPAQSSNFLVQSIIPLPHAFGSVVTRAQRIFWTQSIPKPQVIELLYGESMVLDETTSSTTLDMKSGGCCWVGALIQDGPVITGRPSERAYRIYVWKVPLVPLNENSEASISLDRGTLQPYLKLTLLNRSYSVSLRGPWLLATCLDKSLSKPYLTLVHLPTKKDFTIRHNEEIRDTAYDILTYSPRFTASNQLNENMYMDIEKMTVDIFSVTNDSSVPHHHELNWKLTKYGFNDTGGISVRTQIRRNIYGSVDGIIRKPFVHRIDHHRVLLVFDSASFGFATLMFIDVNDKLRKGYIWTRHICMPLTLSNAIFPCPQQNAVLVVMANGHLASISLTTGDTIHQIPFDKHAPPRPVFSAKIIRTPDSWRYENFADEYQDEIVCLVDMGTIPADVVPFVELTRQMGDLYYAGANQETPLDITLSHLSWIGQKQSDNMMLTRIIKSLTHSNTHQPDAVVMMADCNI